MWARSTSSSGCPFLRGWLQSRHTRPYAISRQRNARATRHHTFQPWTREKVLDNESVTARVRPVPSLPHSFVLAGFLMERGEGGWGGTTSQGRIERCCLVRRIGDGACAGLQMLAQRVQHMRGSNNARLLPACSYSFCVLTGYVRAQEGSHCPQAPREGPGQRRCVRFSVSPNAKRRWATMQVVPCLIWLVALPSRPSHRDACLGEANA